MNLYAHQQKIFEDDPKKTGLFLGTGSGKTRIALKLARDKTLVIAPKTQVEDRNWEREHDILNKASACMPIDLKVISKEAFRRDAKNLGSCKTLIVDEAHTVLGVTPNTRQRNRQQVPKASQLFDELEAYVARVKPERIYLATATIVKSPMTVWAARWILRKGSNRNKLASFLQWRDRFYVRLPMPGREIYAPRRDAASKNLLAKYVRDTGYVGRLEDYFDVPEQTFRTIHVGLTELQKKRLKELPLEFPDPIVLIGKKHQVENGVLSGDEYSAAEIFPNEKIEKLLELAEEFPRMVIFAKYTQQIRSIENAFHKAKKPILTMDGKTKDRGSLFKEAEKRLNCAFLCQAQISAGWELPEYPVMVFASMSYSFVDRVQALGRIQRANNIKKNLYIDLVVKGGIDEAVQKAVENKQDFDERIYLGI